MTSSLEPIVVLSLVVGVIAALILVGVSIALVLFAVRYRAGRAGAAQQIYGSQRLEIAWTAAPVIVLAIVFALSVVTLGQIGRGATFSSLEPPLHVTVTGHQWWFEFRYPDGTVTANEAHIPIGVPIELELHSADVIHAFWVPELGAKMDMIPGQTNVLRLFTARPGTFGGACAEFCGVEHAWMRIRVVAEARGAFDRWLSAQAAGRVVPHGPAADGERVFLTNVCSSCHAIRGTRASAAIGPDLTHVGSRATIAGGVLTNDAAAMRSWLADPQRYKPGTQMPRVPLAAADLDALVAYLESLK
ncbi:MAG: cytochrome c oxidase subunit II [Candidatus Limnocylindria bacterium]